MIKIRNVHYQHPSDISYEIHLNIMRKYSQQKNKRKIIRNCHNTVKRAKGDIY